MVDYIDRNAFIEHIKKDPLFDVVEQYGITEVIESFPAADVKPVVHGKWNWEGNNWIEGITDYEWWECSSCGNTVTLLKPYKDITYRYCPHCGARNDGEQ